MIECRKCPKNVDPNRMKVLKGELFKRRISRRIEIILNNINLKLIILI